MAACLLIGLYVGDELSYDDFHAAADRIHVMGVDNSYFGRSTATSYPLAPAMEASLPAVEHAVRTVGRGEIVMRRPDHSMEAKRQLLLADSTFFQVFDFSLVRGRSDVVLDWPDAAVITETMARDFFGNDDPIGKVTEVAMKVAKCNRQVVFYHGHFQGQFVLQPTLSLHFAPVNFFVFFLR